MKRPDDGLGPSPDLNILLCYRRTSVTHLICGHVNVPHKARGLCQKCYSQHHHAGTLSKFSERRPPATTVTCEHPDRPHRGLGMCGSCLNRDRYSRSPEKRSEVLRKAREHRRKNRDDPEYKMRQRRYRCQSRYGITLEEYEKIYQAQNGLCAICHQPERPGRENLLPLTIDHDHRCCPQRSKTCGRCVRGLLCGACNRGIGTFRDNIHALEGAIAYLKRFATSAD